MKLSDIQDIFETYNDLQEFQNNDGSILTFIMHSMKKRNTLKVIICLFIIIYQRKCIKINHKMIIINVF